MNEITYDRRRTYNELAISVWYMATGNTSSNELCEGVALIYTPSIDILEQLVCYYYRFNTGFAPSMTKHLLNLFFLSLTP